FTYTLLGTIVFNGALLSKGTIHIYDERRNAYQSVGNVPDLILILSGGVNMANRIFRESIELNSANPYAMDDLKLKMLESLYSGARHAIPFHLRRSLNEYYGRCSPMAYSNGAASIQNVLYGATNGDTLIDELTRFRSGAEFTTVYTDANPEGIAVTCRAAWHTNTNTALTSAATVNKATDYVCQKAGFDTTKAAQLAACRSRIDDLPEFAFNRTMSRADLVAQAMASEAVVSTLISDSEGEAIRYLGGIKR